MPEEKKAAEPKEPAKPVRLRIVDHEAVRDALDAVPRAFVGGHVVEVSAADARRLKEHVDAGHLEPVKGD